MILIKNDFSAVDGPGLTSYYDNHGTFSRLFTWLCWLLLETSSICANKKWEQSCWDFHFFSLGFLLIWKIIRGADWKKVWFPNWGAQLFALEPILLHYFSMQHADEASAFLTFDFLFFWEFYFFFWDFWPYFAAYTFRTVKCYYSHYNVVFLLIRVVSNF